MKPWSAACIAVALTVLVGRAEDKRVVLIAGRPSHPHGEHEFRAGCLLLQRCLATAPGLRVEVHTNGWPHRATGPAVEDDAALEGAAAVVIYADGGSGHPALQGGHLATLDRLAGRGVGLGFMHYGVEVPKGAGGEAFTRWVGGYYEDHYSVNPMWSPAFAPLPNHPIARGVQPFSNRDEWYFNLRGLEAPKAGLTPILVATPPDTVRNGPYVWPQGPYPHIVAASGRAETLLWAFERTDGGRGFGFTGGHTHAHWGDNNQRKILLNAILWIAHIDPPAGGFESTVTPDELAANLDKK